MRIDKFLKVSRLVKRREVAKQLCDASKVYVNSKPAKASTEVKEGDLLKIILGNRIIEGKINCIKPFANKIDSQEMFTFLNGQGE